MKQQKILVLSIIILAVALIVFATACTDIQDTSTITYMADGKEYASVTLSGDETPSAPADPEKTGYNFVGWFMDETFATPFNFAEYAANPDRTNITVYAKFEIISTTITYMADGAEYEVLTVEGVNAEDPNYLPEKTGYTFVGWFTDDTLETPFDFEEYAADEDRTNITVYAKFEIISTTITYMADGKVHAMVDVYAFETPSSPANPEKAGYAFAGWFADETFETPFSLDEYVAAQDKTDIIVYAKFDGYFTYTENNSGCTITGLSTTGAALTDIVIPDTYEGLPVTAIGDMAFDENSKITSVTLGKNVTEIGAGAFDRCELLQTAALNEGLKTIGNNAFSNCALTEIPALPASLTTLGNYVFAYNEYVTSLTIPDHVTTIGHGIVASCYLLESMNVPSQWYSADDPTKLITYFTGYFFGNTEDPENPELRIPLYANRYPYFESITVRGDMEKLPTYAFFQVESLKSVELTGTFTKIGDNAFANCYALESLVLPDAVTEVGETIFAGCESLKELSMPLAGNMTLESLFGNIKPPLESVRIYTSGKITAMFRNCYSLKKIVIEGNVTEIGKEAFYSSRVLTDLTLPASVTHIEDIFIYFYFFQSDFKVTYEGTMAQWHEITLESADLDPPIPVICTDGTTTWNKPQAQASEIAL